MLETLELVFIIRMGDISKYHIFLDKNDKMAIFSLIAGVGEVYPRVLLSPDGHIT